ncbi:unnamed protein product [Lampetra fluviatilis]
MPFVFRAASPVQWCAPAPQDTTWPRERAARPGRKAQERRIEGRSKRIGQTDVKVQLLKLRWYAPHILAGKAPALRSYRAASSYRGPTFRPPSTSCVGHRQTAAERRSIAF